jgi:hypothetical protein
MLPTDPKARKAIPLYTGLVKYFPDALAEVAKVSFVGNEQHNPGQPLRWAREKSVDQEDTLLRHLFEAGTRDTDGQRHSAKVAWRALALLQLEIERDNANSVLKCADSATTSQDDMGGPGQTAFDFRSGDVVRTGIQREDDSLGDNLSQGAANSSVSHSAFWDEAPFVLSSEVHRSNRNR